MLNLKKAVIRRTVKLILNTYKEVLEVLSEDKIIDKVIDVSCEVAELVAPKIAEIQSRINAEQEEIDRLDRETNEEYGNNLEKETVTQQNN